MIFAQVSYKCQDLTVLLMTSLLIWVTALKSEKCPFQENVDIVYLFCNLFCYCHEQYLNIIQISNEISKTNADLV